MLDWPATEADNVNWWRAARDGNEKSLTKGIFWDDVKFISRWYSGWHWNVGAQFEVIFPGIRITIRKRNNFDLRNRYWTSVSCNMRYFQYWNILHLIFISFPFTFISFMTESFIHINIFGVPSYQWSCGARRREVGAIWKKDSAWWNETNGREQYGHDGIQPSASEPAIVSQPIQNT